VRLDRRLLRSLRRAVRLAVYAAEDAEEVGLARIVVEEADLDYATALAVVEAVKELRELFPHKSESWFLRAAVRSLGVREVRGNVWVVPGFPELGDYYSEYVVRFSGGKYSCDCFARSYGYVRSARICTHVAAVMVYRRARRRLSAWLGDLY